MERIDDQRRWTIDERGRVRPGSDEAGRAGGWVDARAGVGVIEQLDGEPARMTRMPSEILDVLEGRYPGTRWFIGAGLAQAW